MFPFVTVLVPCYNEERYIASVMENMLGQDYPSDRLEVFIIDGMSADGTRGIIKRYAEEHSLIRLVDNERRYVPFGLNSGIRMAQGEVIERMDAHALSPANDSPKAVAIATALSSQFGVSNGWMSPHRPVDHEFPLDDCLQLEVGQADLSPRNAVVLVGDHENALLLHLVYHGGMVGHGFGVGRIASLIADLHPLELDEVAGKQRIAGRVEFSSKDILVVPTGAGIVQHEGGEIPALAPVNGLSDLLCHNFNDHTVKFRDGIPGRSTKRS